MKYLFIFLSISLSSCSILDTGKVAPGYKEAFYAIKGVILGGNENSSLNREVVDQIPYASALLKIGKGSSGLVILETIQNNKETWVSADGVYLVIKDGRIIQTAGLENNLTNLIFGDYNFSDYLEQEIKNNLIYYYSYDNPLLTDLKVEVTLRLKQKEKVTILNVERDLFVIEEVINNSYIGWKRKNIFWIDDKGFTWKSVQNISPKLPPFFIQVTKKPAY